MTAASVNWLTIGYVVCVGPAVLCALMLPLAWWRPIIGLVMAWLMLVGFTIGMIIMNLSVHI